MKSLNKIKKLFEAKEFDLGYESGMVQARILGPIVGLIQKRNIKQDELEKLTGLKQPFLSGLFGGVRRLNMEHIAKLQYALDITLQQPEYLTNIDHKEKHYSTKDNQTTDLSAVDSIYDNEKSTIFIKFDTYRFNEFENEHIAVSRSSTSSSRMLSNLLG